MSRQMVKKPGYYPDAKENERMTKKVIRIGMKQSFLLVTYESSRLIAIYVGGHDKWCIHCEIAKSDNMIKPKGYLIKVRYDMYCSLEHSFLKGKDTKELMYFLIQYIHNTYPEVKELSFNDLSTRSCDNDADVNLTVMTYLYSNNTWYGKNFGAYVDPSRSQEWNRIQTDYESIIYEKTVKWDTMKETIINDSKHTGILDNEMEELYNKATSWKEFFEPIYHKMKIDKFCIFISSWIDGFIIKYFNTLQGLTYLMPIKDYNIVYTESEYKRGGKRFTKKSTRKRDRDYK